MKRLLSTLLIIMIIIGCTVPVLAASGTEYRTWLQSDSRWGSVTFGTSDTMSKSGCAITSVAKLMVHSQSVSSDPSVFNPGIFCNWLKKNGGLTSQGWIVWSAISKYTSKFSYSGAAALNGSQSQKTATIQSYIKDGYVVVAMVKNGGHYVAVDKVSDNTVYILDPANTGYNKLFQYDAAGVTKIQIFKGVTNGGSNTPTTPTYDLTVDPVGAGNYIITSDNGVNLRSGAGTSNSVLTAIPYNASVKVTKVDNGWGYTSYNGKSGWFSLQYAKMDGNPLRGLELKAPAKTTYQIGEPLNIDGISVTALYADGTSKTIKSGYNVAGFSSKNKGSCKVYVTYQTKSAVFNVTITDKQEVVYKPGIYVIDSSNGVNLRDTASTSGTILTAIPNTTRVTVTEVKNDWGKVSYQGHTGWFCLEYAKVTSAVQTGIQATPKTNCFLSGSSISSKDFTVQRVFSDGSVSPLTSFTIKLGAIVKNQLPVTITDGSFSTTVHLQIFETIPMGDCNFDGKVDASDALATLQYAVGKSKGTFYAEVADVNQDNAINSADALYMLRFAVGKLDSFVTPTSAAQ